VAVAAAAGVWSSSAAEVVRATKRATVLFLLFSAIISSSAEGSRDDNGKGKEAPIPLPAMFSKLGGQFSMMCVMRAARLQKDKWG
jgi:hypothetical protein